MKIIDAYWEKRNLGVDVFEIIVDENDCKNTSSLLSLLEQEKFKNSYTLIKLPPKEIYALHELEKNGYSFMETLIMFHIAPPKYTTPEFCQPLANSFSYEEITKNSPLLSQLIEGITEDTYISDRIYLDPQFGNKFSLIRYKNWCYDLQKNPEASFCTARHKTTDAIVGFCVFVSNFDELTAHTCLTSVFPQYQGKGYGAMMMDMQIQTLKKLEILNLYESVSSNNIPKLRINSRMGLNIHSLAYCLRRLPI